MGVMDRIHKINVSQIAAQLPFPFSMVDLAFVDDIAVSVYICQGTLEWHKHTDNDELFWVHEGEILLESEWGDVQMKPGKVALVPKGVEHRTGADARSSVILVRCGILPHRKNGRRRIYALPNDEGLAQANLFEMARTLPDPFKFQTVLPIEDAVVQVGRGEGTWPVKMHLPYAVMYLVLNGSAHLSTPQSVLRMQVGDMAVVPKGVPYQLITGGDTWLARLSKAKIGST